MTISVKATVACNLNCKYCYEKEFRKTGKLQSWDIKKIKKAMKKEYERTGKTISLHGGEPLVLPKKDLEELFAYAKKLGGSTGLQTNGLAIDDDHIEMFKKYDVHVGISFDGPGELNRLRSTKKQTDIIEKNFYKLVANDINPGNIIVLSKANGLPKQRAALKDWIKELRSLGVNGGRLNLVKVDDPELRPEIELTEEEAIDLYTDLADFILVEEDNLRGWQPFRDVIDNMLGLGMGTCIFTKCDNYRGVAERVINGDGTLSYCFKTGTKDFVYLREPDKKPTTERYDMLGQVPQEHGGCKDCKYWRICYGGCPSEGMEDGEADWRYSGRYCNVWKALYERAEKAIKRLMPNVELVIDKNVDDEEKFYQARRSNRMEPSALRLLTKNDAVNPSASSSSVRTRRSNKCKNNKNDKKSRVVKDTNHGDHMDHGDSH